MRIDLADHSPVPSIFNVFTAPGPPNEPACRAYVQVEVSGSGVTLRVDPDAAPDGFEARVDLGTLAAPPSPCAEGLARGGDR